MPHIHFVPATRLRQLTIDIIAQPSVNCKPFFYFFPAMCDDCIVAERNSDEPIDDQRAVRPHSRRHSFFQLLPAFSIPSGGFDRKYSCRMGYHGLAESLHISQPRCSSGLMELEQKLGKPLFLRGKRKITLSADAP